MYLEPITKFHFATAPPRFVIFICLSCPFSVIFNWKSPANDTNIIQRESPCGTQLTTPTSLDPKGQVMLHVESIITIKPCHKAGHKTMYKV
jgi:hypothetical protein